MTGLPEARAPDDALSDAMRIDSLPDLALLLRRLRRRDARRRALPQATYRELAARAGCSRAIVGEYFTGKALPPPDRFDILIRLLGANPAEQRAFATARDQVEERRRRNAAPGAPPAPLPGRPLNPPWVADGHGHRVVPRQLPPALWHFAGREAEVALLTSLLAHTGQPAEVAVRQPAALAATGRPAPSRGSVTIAVITGTAGAGKTALALRWAHHVTGCFPDGQLYVNLRGFGPTGPPMSPAEAVRGFLDALGVPPDQIPDGLDTMTGLYRSLLADRSVLVVVDNARDCEQVRPLLPGSPRSMVVVTSRSCLTHLISAEAAQPVSLGLLTPAQGRELLVRRLGEPVVLAEARALDEIVSACAGLPLALGIVAARSASHPDFPLAALAGELRGAREDAGRSLDALNGGDPGTDVRAVFSWSYRALTPPAAAMFGLLGVHPGPGITAAAAASLSGTPPWEARAALAELARAHLIAEHRPGRFALHDLLHAYARELAHQHGHAQRAVWGRLLGHYLHSAHAAARQLNPYRDPIGLSPPVSGVTPEAFTALQAAQAWFTAEHAIVATAIRHAAALGFDAEAWQLAWTLDDFFDRQGRWHDWESVQRTALQTARRAGDTSAQAGALCALGTACDRLGRYDDARRHLLGALGLYRAAGDGTGLAQARLKLGGLSERQGRYTESLGHGLAALSLYRSAGHLPGQAEALNLVGWSHARLGGHRPAIAYCQLALSLQQDLGDRRGEANTWDSLGYSHHRLGGYHQAAHCYTRALELFRCLGDRYFEAVTLTHLGDTCRAVDDLPGARRAWQAALAMLAGMDHASTGQVRGKADCPGAEQVRARLRALGGSLPSSTSNG